jgi:hypothetical protein
VFSRPISATVLSPESTVGSEAQCNNSLVSRASNMAKNNDRSTKTIIISSRVCPTCRAIFANKSNYSTHTRNGGHYCVPRIGAPLQVYVVHIPVVASPAVDILNSEMSMFAHTFLDQEYGGEDSTGGGVGDDGVEDYVTSAAPPPAPNKIAHLGVPMSPHRFISWFKYVDPGLLPAEDRYLFRSNDNLADNDQYNSSSESSNNSDEDNQDHFSVVPLPIPGGIPEELFGNIVCNHIYQASKFSTLEDDRLHQAQENLMFHIKENCYPLGLYDFVHNWAGECTYDYVSPSSKTGMKSMQEK